MVEHDAFLGPCSCGAEHTERDPPRWVRTEEAKPGHWLRNASGELRLCVDDKLIVTPNDWGGDFPETAGCGCCSEEWPFTHVWSAPGVNPPPCS